MNKDITSDTYILPTGELDKERLGLLNEIYGKYSRAAFDRTNLKNGQKIAIFGCGSGEGIDYIYKKIGKGGKILCIDISSEQIEVAKKSLKEKGILNVEYKIADAQAIYGDENYDFVYCRFVLAHLHKPQKAIECMLSHLKKEGFIICDEYSTSIRYCYPNLKSFDKLVDISKKSALLTKKDPKYSEKLFHEMLNFDVEPINFELNIPIFNSSRKKQFLIKSWEGIKNKGLIRDVVSDKELESIISELKKYQNDETMYQSAGALFQYIGRKK